MQPEVQSSSDSCTKSHNPGRFVDTRSPVFFRQLYQEPQSRWICRYQESSLLQTAVPRATIQVDSEIPGDQSSSDSCTKIYNPGRFADTRSPVFFRQLYQEPQSRWICRYQGDQSSSDSCTKSHNPLNIIPRIKSQLLYNVTIHAEISLLYLVLF